MLFSISKQTSSKLQSQLRPISQVISGVIPHKGKRNSILLLEKIQDFIKICDTFLVFPVSLRGWIITPKGLSASKHGSKMNRNNKSASCNDKLNLEAYWWCIEYGRPGHTYEHQWAQIGKNMIWEENEVKLVGIATKNELKLYKQISNIWLKANKKLSILCRLKNILTFQWQRILFKSLFEIRF